MDTSGYLKIRMDKNGYQTSILLETQSGFRLFLLAAASSLIGTFSLMSCTSMG
jgi:hypothetical protein